MEVAQIDLGQTVQAMRPMVPARNFGTSKRFYEELGFRSEILSDELVEMHLGAYSFILQNYYVKEWANNFVMHMRVSDVGLWWRRIVALDLPRRYGIKTSEPKGESWGLVAGFIDPSGVLWRIAAPLPTHVK